MDVLFNIVGVSSWDKYLVITSVIAIVVGIALACLIQLGFMVWAYIDDTSAEEVCKSFGKKFLRQRYEESLKPKDRAEREEWEFVRNEPGCTYLAYYLVFKEIDSGYVWGKILLAITMLMGTLWASPILLGPALPLTIGIAISVALIKVARMARRTKKAFDKHVVDKEAHQ